MLIDVYIGGEVFLAAIFFVLYLAAAVVDFKRRIIPNWLIAALCAVWIARCCFRLVLGQISFSQIILSVPLAAGSLVFLLFLSLAFEKAFNSPSMGGGDIKLISASVLIAGPDSCLLLLLAICIAGLCLALAYRACGKKEFPLGPAIAFASIAVYLA